ncbi:START domain, partial [Trinorchestia longiramus]
MSRPAASQSWDFTRLALLATKFALRRGFRTGFLSSAQAQNWCRVFGLIGNTAGKYIWRQSAGVLLGAVCLVHKFDFENNGITDAHVERCREENKISGIKALIEATVMCPVCGKRQVLQEQVPGVEYCACKDGGGVEWERSHDGWQPFLERENILVWRRPHQAWPHLFAYKVYGRYDDVSLCAFVETQLSTSYRTKWDPSALDLRVLHSDSLLPEAGMEPSDKDKAYSAQDLLYWLIKFPRFFANRDYVFKRRYRADVPRQEVVIVSEAASSRCGVDEVSGVHRVHDYWSVMVVRAKNSDFTQ